MGMKANIKNKKKKKAEAKQKKQEEKKRKRTEAANFWDGSGGTGPRPPGADKIHVYMWNNN